MLQTLSLEIEIAINETLNSQQQLRLKQLRLQLGLLASGLRMLFLDNNLANRIGLSGDDFGHVEQRYPQFQLEFWAAARKQYVVLLDSNLQLALDQSQLARVNRHLGARSWEIINAENLTEMFNEIPASDKHLLKLLLYPSIRDELKLLDSQLESLQQLRSEGNTLRGELINSTFLGRTAAV